MMVVPPDKPCLSFPKQFKAVFPGRAYSGLSARAMEYFINYGITGATSVYVIMMFNSLGLGDDTKENNHAAVDSSDWKTNEAVKDAAAAVPAQKAA